MHFWTAETGDAAKDRNLLCSCVGFDGGVMRERVISILEGDDRPIAAYGGYSDLKNVEDARVLWAAGKRHFVAAQAAREARLSAKPLPKVKSPPAEKPPTPPFHWETADEERKALRALIMQKLAAGPMTKRELYEATKPAKSSAVASHLYHAERQGHIEVNGYHYSVKTSNEDTTPQLSVAANSG